MVLAVSDLAAAGEELEARHGLASIEGGRHPGWGTANRIVPLGETYLELVAVADEREAGRNPFGSWVAAADTESMRPLGWAVRTTRLDEVARRLGLAVTEGSRIAGDGVVLRWRIAGIEHAAAEPSLPFLIEWGSETPLPGDAAVHHPAGAVRIAAVRVQGDPDRLAAWLGPNDLPLEVRPGKAKLESVVLASDRGTIAL